MTERTPDPGEDLPQVAATYPDLTVLGWLRTEEIEFLDLHIRMTIRPGASIVELWELDTGRPVRWIGNAFRLGADTPCLYLNYQYEQAIPRHLQRDSLAAAAATFWKS